MSDLERPPEPTTRAGWYPLNGELCYWDGRVNFLLGWTLIGWVVALVMACQPHQVAAVRM